MISIRSKRRLRRPVAARAVPTDLLLHERLLIRNLIASYAGGDRPASPPARHLAREREIDAELAARARADLRAAGGVGEPGGPSEELLIVAPSSASDPKKT